MKYPYDSPVGYPIHPPGTRQLAILTDKDTDPCPIGRQIDQMDAEVQLFNYAVGPTQSNTIWVYSPLPTEQLMLPGVIQIVDKGPSPFCKKPPMTNTEIIESFGWEHKEKLPSPAWPDKTFFFLKGNYGVILDERRRYTNVDNISIWVKDVALHNEMTGSDATPGHIYFAFRGTETMKAIEILLGFVEN